MSRSLLAKPSAPLAALLLLAGVGGFSPASSAATQLLVTPSAQLAYFNLDSSSAGYQVDAHLLLWGVELEALTQDQTYHRLQLSSSLLDQSSVSALADDRAQVDVHRASYRLGAAQIPAGVGELNLWTGVGWQGVYMDKTSAGKGSIRHAYLPFGGEWSQSLAPATFSVIGAEYRLLMQGREHFPGSTRYRFDLSNARGWAAWIGLDHSAEAQRSLVARLMLEHWTMERSASRQLAGSRSYLLTAVLGVRF